eukprot:13704758-Heterocapsa_arctica.AAC.1
MSARRDLVARQVELREETLHEQRCEALLEQLPVQSHVEPQRRIDKAVDGLEDLDEHARLRHLRR